MALIKCPECGKNVSDTIENCIHCGYKLKQKENKKEPVISTEPQDNKDSIITNQPGEQEYLPNENNIGCSKAIFITLGVIAIFILLVFAFASCINKCDSCTHGYIPCENCNEGKSICTDCNGELTVECNSCNEKGKEKCKTCNGTGNGKKYSSKCYTCGGNGKILLDCDNCGGLGKTYSVQGFVRCMHCNGSGQASPVKCPVCGGDGITSGYEDCKACEGKRYGKETCTKCNGTKKTGCISCSSTGFIICPKCDGTQKVVCTKCSGDGVAQITE